MSNEIVRLAPIQVGDRFYHKKPGMTVPDLLEVIDIWEKNGSWFFRAKYLYHTIGPTFERTFSDMIFKDDSWVIIKKGSDEYE